MLKNAWRGKSQLSVDDATKCYRVVPLDTIIDPADTVEDYLENSKRLNIPMDCLYIDPNKTLSYTCKELINYNVGAALVVENKKLIGIFTERDVVKIISRFNAQPINDSICNFMTKKVTTVYQSQKLANAMKIMIKKKIRHLPIIEEKNSKILGMISIKDFAFNILK